MESNTILTPKADDADDSVVTRRTLLIAGGLLGTICIVFLASMLSLPHLDAWLTVALYAFVVAMPCLGYVIAVETLPHGWLSKDVPDDIRGWFEHGENAMRGTPQRVAAEIGPIVAIIGVAAAVGHISFPAFLIFVVTSVIIVALYVRAFNAARKSASSVRQTELPSKEGESRQGVASEKP